MYFSSEPDEFWSFVGNKSNQRWTWYAIERRSGIILAWHNGKRRDKDFLVLRELLKPFSIRKSSSACIESCFSIYSLIISSVTVPVARCYKIAAGP
ncbi:MAG: hypothetical protein LBJ63_07005 [Prevotellaceae bacterium]|nr:hypothetical protein [Prevotellaceae bacterium]